MPPFPSNADRLTEIKSKLLSLLQNDQSERRSGKVIHEHDKARLLELRTVIEEAGWPSEREFGKEAAAAAWLIVQHADFDPEYQEACLELMKQEKADPILIAYLTDRIMKNKGEQQTYGTQFGIIEGEFRVWPIKDRDQLDERRTLVGLEPFEAYEKRMMEAQKRLEA